MSHERVEVSKPVVVVKPIPKPTVYERYGVEQPRAIPTQPQPTPQPSAPPTPSHVVTAIDLATLGKAGATPAELQTFASLHGKTISGIPQEATITGVKDVGKAIQIEYVTPPKPQPQPPLLEQIGKGIAAIPQSLVESARKQLFPTIVEQYPVLSIEQIHAKTIQRAELLGVVSMPLVAPAILPISTGALVMGAGVSVGVSEVASAMLTGKFLAPQQIVETALLGEVLTVGHAVTLGIATKVVGAQIASSVVGRTALTMGYGGAVGYVLSGGKPEVTIESALLAGGISLGGEALGRVGSWAKSEIQKQIYGVSESDVEKWLGPEMGKTDVDFPLIQTKGYRTTPFAQTLQKLLEDTKATAGFFQQTLEEPQLIESFETVAPIKFDLASGFIGGLSAITMTKQDPTQIGKTMEIQIPKISQPQLLKLIQIQKPVSTQIGEAMQVQVQKLATTQISEALQVQSQEVKQMQRQIQKQVQVQAQLQMQIYDLGFKPRRGKKVVPMFDFFGAYRIKNPIAEAQKVIRRFF